MWEFGINWASKNFTSDLFEFFSLVAEGNDFSWANEGEIERIEEEDNVFSFIVGDADVNEVSVEPSWGFELRGWFSDQWHIFF